MPDDTSITVAVGSAYGPPLAIEVSSRARELCPFLRSIPRGYLLPTVHIESFRITLSYLNGDDALNVLTVMKHDSQLLRLFAQSWALTARMGLVALQNKLISMMTDIYLITLKDSRRNPTARFAVDGNLLYAFQHLSEEIGEDSQAERFLVCFIGRTTSLICELERQLKEGGFDRRICKNLLIEARSFEPDSIENTPRNFHVSVSSPPQYQLPEVQYSPGWMLDPRHSKSPELQDIRRRGYLAQDRRRQPSYQYAMSGEGSDTSTFRSLQLQQDQKLPQMHGDADKSHDQYTDRHPGYERDGSTAIGIRYHPSQKEEHPYSRREPSGRSRATHVPGGWPEGDRSDDGSSRTRAPDVTMDERGYDSPSPPSVRTRDPLPEATFRPPSVLSTSPTNPYLATHHLSMPPHQPSAPSPPGSTTSFTESSASRGPVRAREVFRYDAPVPVEPPAKPAASFIKWLLSDNAKKPEGGERPTAEMGVGRQPGTEVTPRPRNSVPLKQRRPITEKDVTKRLLNALNCIEQQREALKNAEQVDHAPGQPGPRGKLRKPKPTSQLGHESVSERAFDAIDFTKEQEQIEALHAQKIADQPVYEFGNPQRPHEGKTIVPKPVEKPPPRPAPTFEIGPPGNSPPGPPGPSPPTGTTDRPRDLSPPRPTITIIGTRDLGQGTPPRRPHPGPPSDSPSPPSPHQPNTPRVPDVPAAA